MAIYTRGKQNKTEAFCYSIVFHSCRKVVKQCMHYKALSIQVDPSLAVSEGLVLLSHKWTKQASALKATQLKQHKWVYMGEGQCKGGGLEVGSLYLLLLNHLKIEFAPFRSAFHQKCKLIEMWRTNFLWVYDPRKPFLLRLSKISFMTIPYHWSNFYCKHATEIGQGAGSNIISLWLSMDCWNSL